MATATDSLHDAVEYALLRLGLEGFCLKKEQFLSIKSIYEGNNTFVWLPTGYGKSLCYQALPFVMDHKRGLVGTDRNSGVLVISPLVALIADQIQQLRSNGVKCCVITSASDLPKAFLATPTSLCSDSLLYCTPEALVLPKWRDALEDSSVSIVLLLWSLMKPIVFPKW